jgi:predicted transcriptional regulator
MSVSVLSLIWNCEAINDHAQLLVMLALADFSSDTGESKAGIKRISKKARMSDRTCQRVMAKLEESGFLKIRRGEGMRTKNGSTNLYQIVLKRCQDVTGCQSDTGENLSLVTKRGVSEPEGVTQLGHPNRQEENVSIKSAGAVASVPPKAIDRKCSAVKTKKLEVRADIPIGLRTPAFITAWNEFFEHRKQIRHPMTQLAESKALEKCLRLGEADAISAINHSIACGYQGIFEPNGSNRASSLGQSDSNRKAKQDSYRTFSEP